MSNKGENNDDDDDNNNKKHHQTVVSTAFGVYVKKVRIGKELKNLQVDNKIAELRMLKERGLWQTSGFRRGVIQVLDLLGCYAK